MKRGRKKKDRTQIPLPNLNQWELEVLRDHLPNKKHLWLGILYRLDDLFDNRSDLTWFLHDYLQIPYFNRKTLDNLLGLKVTDKLKKKIKTLDGDKKKVIDLVICFALDDPSILEDLYEVIRTFHNRKKIKVTETKSLEEIL